MPIPTRGSGYVVQHDDWNALVNALNAMTGVVAPFAGTSAPAGYLLCDGTPYSRTTYADLFAVIGTIYGIGDGSTTFNVPDLRQRFPLGKASSGTGQTLGGSGGAIDHTHTVSGLSIPGLDISGAGLSVNGTSDSATDTFNVTSGGPSSVGNSNAPGGANVYADNVHTHSVAGTTGGHSHHINISGSLGPGQSTGTGTTGGGTSSGANPPFLSVNYIIKT